MKQLLVVLLLVVCVAAQTPIAQQSTSPYTQWQWRSGAPMYQPCKTEAQMMDDKAKCSIVTRHPDGRWVVKNWNMPKHDFKYQAKYIAWDQLRPLFALNQMSQYIYEQLPE